MKKINICIVVCNPITKQKADFATQHPISLKKILKEKANILVMYAGYINKEKLHREGIKTFKVINLGKFFNLFILSISALKATDKYNIDIFMNLTAHYLLCPITWAAHTKKRKTIASIGGIPISTHFRGKKSLINSLKKKIGLYIEKVSLNTADKIHLVAKSLETEYQERGYSEKQMNVIPRGIDIDLFYKKKKNHSNKKFIILSVGRLSRMKRFDDVLRAIHGIRDQLGEYEYWIVGEGEMKEKLRALSLKLGISEKVIFWGYIHKDKLKNFYHQVDVFVSASESEGTANVVLEAQISGVPVISTPEGDVKFHLANGRGILYDVGNIQQIIKALLKIKQKKVNIIQMTEMSRKYVIENHSYDKLQNEYLKLFDFN